MTKEDYVSYEVAKLLKEKGFPMDEHLYMYVNKDGKLTTDYQACLTMADEEYRTFFDNYIPTVTQALAMKWLREKGIDIFINTDFPVDRMKYSFKIVIPSVDGDKQTDCIGGNFTTYEEAVEAALKYCLTTIQIYERDKNGKTTQ